MYRKIFDRHAGDLYVLSSHLPSWLLSLSIRSLSCLADHRLEYLETSRNAETGSIRFRRQSLLVTRLGHDGARNIPRSRPRVFASGRAPNEVYVERFGGCEIRLEGAEAEGRMSKIDPDLVL
jgi:hypothetical protein